MQAAANVIPAVCVYVDHSDMHSRLTLASLKQHGVELQTISVKEYPATAEAAGVTTTPCVMVQAHGANFQWVGYRPDLAALLSDFIADGPVPAHGLTDSDQAEAAVLTLAQVEKFIASHHVFPDEFYAENGKNPLYRGSTVLAWLGY